MSRELTHIPDKDSEKSKTERAAYAEAMEQKDYHAAIKSARGFDTAELRENAAIQAIRGAVNSYAKETLIQQMRARAGESRIISLKLFDASVSRAKAERDSVPIGSHNVQTSAKGVWTFSSGQAECCGFCERNTPGVYRNGELMGELPPIIARVIQGRERRAERHFMMADRRGLHRLISWQDVVTGAWAALLDMPLPGDRQIIAALASAIGQIAYGEKMPTIQATPHPDDRTIDGYLPIPVSETLPPGYLEKPDIPWEMMRKSLRKLREILARQPKMALACGASMAGPFIGTSSSGQSRIFDMYGRSQLGKSTTAMVCASLWGNPRMAHRGGIVCLWNTTGQGSGRYMGSVGTLPVFWEEYHAESWDDAADFIMRTTEGNSRFQAKRSGPDSVMTPGWVGVAFLTSNARILEGLGGGRTAGCLARVIEMEAPFTENEAQSKLLKELILSCYGYIGPRGMQIAQPEQFHTLTYSAMEALNAPTGGVPGTVAREICESVAGAVIIDMVLDEVIGSEDRVSDSAIIAAGEAIGKLHLPETDGERMLDALAESFASDPGAWASQVEYEGVTGISKPRTRLTGVYDSDYFYVFPSPWRNLAESSGVDIAIAQSELYGIKALEVPPQRRAHGEWKANAPRWAGLVRCIRIRRDALSLDDGMPGPGNAPEPGPAMPPELPPAAPAMPAQIPLPDAPEPGESLSARQGRHVRAAMDGRKMTSERQGEALANTLRILDESSGLDDSDENIMALATRLAFLNALEGKEKGESGAFAPFKTGKPPMWRPKLPNHIIDATVKLHGYAWERKFRGKVIRLDRNAAWPTAISSARIAHGTLEHTGEMELPESGELRPGLYRMTAYPWHESGMPCPFPGSMRPGDYWIPSPVAELLRDLAKANRWPDSVALDSWTGEPVRLSGWAGFAREVRAYALDYYGRDSLQFLAAKKSVNMAIALMRGSSGEKPGQRIHRCKNARSDWPLIIEAQSAVTLWRIADRTGCAVAVKATDELHIPASKFRELTTGERPVIRMDESEKAFGTFKIKAGE